MTQNQIAFQQLEETKRHNRVGEGIDIARGVTSPITSLIGSGAQIAKYILGGPENGKTTNKQGPEQRSKSIGQHKRSRN